MPYLAIQISFFILIAIAAGIALGWWLKHMISHNEHRENRVALSSTRRNLKDAREQVYELREQYQQAQQEIDKYAQHYNSDVYGEYLDIRKQLQNARLECNHLSSELNQKTQDYKRLEAELSQVQKIVNLQNTRTEEIIQRKMQQLAQNTQHHPNSADKLTVIPEVNANLEKMLNAFGILNFHALAELSVEDANRLASMMGNENFPNYRTIVKQAKQFCADSAVNDTKVAA